MKSILSMIGQYKKQLFHVKQLLFLFYANSLAFVTTVFFVLPDL